MITLSINGDDFSGYVVSAERKHMLCRPVAILDIELDTNLPRDINIYEEVVFYENDTKVFTGYTQNTAQARLPISFSLSCSDVLVRAQDTWVIDQNVSNGETVAHWVGVFLDKSGITNRSLSSDQNVYPGFGWQYVTAMEAIVSTLKMTKYQIYADRNGKVWLTSTQRGTSADATISEYIEYERTRDDSWIRNRAIVIGHGDNVADKTLSNDYIPGETRAVVVATGAIYNAATAWKIVDDMLEEFARPMDVKRVTVPGDPDFEIGQTIRLIDSWSGYNELCLITSVISTYNAQQYTTELILDEKCINFWGWDSPPPEYIIMYCGTWGYGVYTSPNTGIGWSPTGLTGKYVYDIHVISDTEVWAACLDGVYHTITSGDSWTTQSMGIPVDQRPGEAYIETDLYWTGVVTKNSDTGSVFVLAGAFDNGGIWVYYKTGGSWSNVRLV